MKKILIIAAVLTCASTATLEAQFRISRYNGRIKLEHIQTVDHCDFAPEFSVDLSNSDSIVVVEHDLATETTSCQCYFDMEVTFPNPGLGDHAVYVYRSYSDSLMGDSLYFQGSVEFSNTNESWIGGIAGTRSECYNPSSGFIQYPLSLSNEWHYRFEYFPDEYEEGVREEIHKVVTDTTMPNEKSYWVIEITELSDPGPPSFDFLRFDTLEGKVFRYSEGECLSNEFVVYDLNYSELGPYRWNTCFNDWMFFLRFNTFSYTADSSFVVELDSDGLIHTVDEIQEGIGLISSTTSELVTHIQSLQGWIVDGVEGGTLLRTVEGEQVPFSFRLHSPYPNPFNPSTTIEYDLPVRSNVSLVIYDVAGREVWHTVSETQAPGIYDVIWNGTNNDGAQVSTGVYFARLQAGEYSSVVKMVYLR